MSAADRPAAPPKRPSASEGSRRELTVMFCDLVDSTELSERLDPEEFGEVLRAYHEICQGAADRHGAHVAQYLGDGIQLYFGYPQARERDAERAVCCGLDMIDGVRALRSRLERERGFGIFVRVAIHTGLVIVADFGCGDLHSVLALGRTVNLAARLQDFAPADGLLISGATERLVRGRFRLSPLGARRLKGLADAVEVYEVLGGLRSPFGAEGARELSALIGRRQELDLLADRWDQVREGKGQVVSLYGEGGIGKSRLAQAFRRELGTSDHSWLECRGSVHTQNSPFSAVAEMIRQQADIRPDDDPKQNRAKLEHLLAAAGPLSAGTLDAIEALVSSDGRTRPEANQRDILEALVDWSISLAGREPLLFLFDDLQWIDPSTLELIGILTEQASAVHLFVLLLHRLEFEPPWHSPRVTALRLSPLTRAQMKELAVAIRGKELPAGALEQIVERAEGIPFFVEELTRCVGESSAPALDGGEIPSELRASLLVHLDGLGQAEELAKICSVLGREFSYPLVHRVVGADELTLQRDLRRLVEAELIEQRGLPPRATYVFHHPLLLEVAYGSLLHRRRRELHAQVAQVLEEDFPELVQRRPELLARHQAASEQPAEAARSLEHAGSRALARSSHGEAAAHLCAALEQVTRLPDTQERAERELHDQLMLGVARQGELGYGAAEVGRCFERARALAEQVGDRGRLFAALAGLSAFHLLRGELDEALAFAEREQAIAQASGQPLLELWSRYSMGITRLYRGELEPSLAALEGAAALCKEVKPEGLDGIYGGVPEVDACAQGALVLWLLGRSDEARDRVLGAVEKARQVSDPLSLTGALVIAAVLHQLCGDVEAAAKWADASLAVARERDFPFWTGLALGVQGWAHVRRGDAETGCSEIQRGIEAARATGALLGTTYLASLLAGALLESGRPAEGLGVLRRALDQAEHTGDRHFQSELLRLQAECLNASGAAGKAEEAAVRALELAQSQAAGSLELRAAATLMRVCRDPERREDARKALSALLHRLDEDRDTASHTEARELLAAS